MALRRLPEGHHLHDPLPGWTDRCSCAITANGRYHLVFRDITIRRRQYTTGEPAARASGLGQNQCRAEDQVRCMCRCRRTTAAGSATPAACICYVYRVIGIRAAVLQDTDVGVCRCNGESNGNDVRSSGRRRDVFGIVNGLRGDSALNGGTHGACIRVTT